jgi:cytochrome P450
MSEETPMTAPTVDARLLADPVAYTDEARLNAALSRLRAEAPVAYVDAPGYRPFWAVTRHADIMAIERVNELFINAPRPVLMPAEQEELQASHGVRTLIHMDELTATTFVGGLKHLPIRYMMS